MTKHLSHTTRHLISLVLLTSSLVVEDCYAQFIKVDVTVQTKLEVLVISNNSNPDHQISNDNSKPILKTQEFTWFEIRSRENIIIAVEVLCAYKGISVSDACYINTGYFDKANATNFGNKPQGFPMNNNNNSQRYLNKDKYRCWIGVSGKNPVELNIAYN